MAKTLRQMVAGIAAATIFAIASILPTAVYATEKENITHPSNLAKQVLEYSHKETKTTKKGSTHTITNFPLMGGRCIPSGQVCFRTKKIIYRDQSPVGWSKGDELEYTFHRRVANGSEKNTTYRDECTGVKEEDYTPWERVQDLGEPPRWQDNSYIMGGVNMQTQDFARSLSNAQLRFEMAQPEETGKTSQ